TLDYMRLSGRSEDQVELVEKYAKAQGMWRNPGDEPIFTSVLELDMNDVEASLAGPKRPQDRVALPDVPKAFAASSELEVNATHKDRLPVDYVMNGHQYQLPDGAVVIAAIT
ncbi:aconitase family protein, partial [Escherichia coli]